MSILQPLEKKKPNVCRLSFTRYTSFMVNQFQCLLMMDHDRWWQLMTVQWLIMFVDLSHGTKKQGRPGVVPGNKSCHIPVGSHWNPRFGLDEEAPNIGLFNLPSLNQSQATITVTILWPSGSRKMLIKTRPKHQAALVTVLPVCRAKHHYYPIDCFAFGPWNGETNLSASSSIASPTSAYRKLRFSLATAAFIYAWSCGRPPNLRQDSPAQRSTSRWSPKATRLWQKSGTSCAAKKLELQ